ncbi:MAG: GLUG motif-containing protein [Sedimentisphaerales bacterium]
MRSKSNLISATAILVVLGLCGSAWAFSGSGSGTEADPYVITTVQQLQEMQDDLNAYYLLGNDIDASDTKTWNGGQGFLPIGTTLNPFTGTFDGQRHMISSLFINRPTTNEVGLFGCIGDGAVVCNVGLAEVDITARINSGSLVGYSGGSTVCNSWSSGSVRGSHNYQMRLGGLIGASSGADTYVYQCFSRANVTATGGAHQVGGLAGYNGHGSIMSDCYATGNVSGYWKVGGLVGDNPYPEGGYITRCYSIGRVTGIGGGLVGFNYKGGRTYDSYWDINTSGKTTSAGGIGKTTAEMMQQATFVNWDFIEVWDIVEDETYPFLRPFLKPIPVTIDIKPGSCPNPLNVKSKGVLPVAILGSEEFDVNSIDIASIRLAGVAAIRSSFEDVGTPFVDVNECECSTEGLDGFLDLTLKFETRRIVEAIGEVNDGDELVLELTGVLSDETPIEGSDCVIIRGRHKPINKADFNGDGTVDMADFAAFAENWLQSSIVEY